MYLGKQKVLTSSTSLKNSHYSVMTSIQKVLTTFHFVKTNEQVKITRVMTSMDEKTKP